MEKLKMHSPNLVAQNIEQLAALFPNCVTELRGKDGKLKQAIDFDLLKQELSDHIVDGPQERYELNWPGKREALLTANAPIAKTLRPCREESVDFDTTKNLFIEGDNLDALKLLQETYLGKVKLIYIDPPYNTGKDFIYKDTFASDQISHQVASGDRSDEGVRLVANLEDNGRFHSNWLTMIAPRIRLAKNMLRQDGAIFVSCDEGEHPRLRLIMDEIFGQSNFVADMVWAAGRKNDSRLVSVSHEYIVCYARDVEYLRAKQVTWRQRKKGLDEIYAQFERLKRQNVNDYKVMTEGLREWYRSLADGHPSKNHKHYNNIDKRGIYFAADISWPGGGGPKYEVLHPITKKPVKVPSRGWMTSDPKRMQEWVDEDRVHFGDDENSVPCIKSYLKDKEQQTPYSVFYQDGRAASKRLRALMDGDLFDFPKDEIVLQEVVEMLTESDDIVVDFFAGSSTTAHSVMLQNATDGGNRRFVMVQLDEKTSEKSAAFQAGFETIPEVSRERIRRAGKSVLSGACHDKWNQDIGFRVLKIDSSNMSEVYYNPDAIAQTDLFAQVENVKEDRTEEDLLFQVMLDWGVDLALPIRHETIAGKTVFFVDADSNNCHGALVACFDKTGAVNEAFIKALAAFSPLRLVFRDAGFASDAAKINVEQLLKQLSPTTDVKTI
ncbi:site-specific DNA-methyltransferase [Shewanella litorisediminis]|uniref:site-specific DNA-methyltransferase (adenine-specific) n=1 Tax=Shewanella litorisediminis TaxID=1173586 RepID=A0ABX7G064_9GAMM|nr:site-specific DNA-methyltransferase [Shewanella litorisediminis]MCL2918286.1 site-specific DNA-methyltransferase [Shewanella litorisediminis]QRH00665.1 site-specific DNA-methyltransferase [Shewanella litorisediminis]